ncbi:MAG TPA: hypothetical protein VNK95_03330, partial [Caldilineaceae bacterium]|nr:hypothetical protein [Caldilineaceae bacterium]
MRLEIAQLLTRFDPQAGTLTEGRETQRRLSEMQGCFADEAAYAAALAQGDPILYTTCTVEPATG